MHELYEAHFNELVSLILWASYVGSRKGAATFGDATRMKLFGFLRSRLELHVEVERLHVEVKCCG